MNHQNKTIKANSLYSLFSLVRNNFPRFLKRTPVFVTATILIVGGFFVANNVFATATITPATNGTSISIDNTSAFGGTEEWTSLTGPTITESTVGDIALGLHTVTLPAGWEFNTGQNVTITLSDATGLTLESAQVTPLVNTLSFTVATVSSTAGEILTFSDVQVRPTGTVSGTSGNITMTAGVIAGVDGETNFGTLSTVAGTVTKLAFTTQPTLTVYGSNINPAVVVNTQDQFGNNSTSELTTSDNVTLTLSSGAGALIGDTALDIGTGSGNGIVSYSTVQVNTAGTGKVITATSASGLISAVSSSFSIAKANPTITLTVSSSYTYDGTPKLAAVALSVDSTPGTVNNILIDGVATQTSAGSYAVTANFVPNDADNYNTLSNVYTDNSFVINKAVPDVTLTVTNSSTAYTGVGQSAEVTQSGASTPGAVANILTGDAPTQTNAGTYEVTADFVPNDADNYETITAQAGEFVITRIDQTALTITGPASATFNTTPTLTSSGGSGTGDVTFTTGASTGCTVLGDVLTVTSVGGTCEVTATKALDNNYNVASSVATPVTLAKATPIVTLTVDNSATYTGVGQSATVAQSGASTPGAVANILTGGTATQINAGTYEVTADFVPTDSTNYETIPAQGAGNFVISKATPVITWANPVGIVYGTALSSTQLNASTPVAGSFVYIPASSVILNAGNAQTLSTDFTPTDSSNYNPVNGQTVTINVAKATPTVTLTLDTPSVAYNGSGQSSAVTQSGASTPGEVVNISVGGAVSQIDAGTYAVTANFVPTDSTNYETIPAQGAGNFVISKATPVITWANPVGISAGTALNGTQLNASATGVAGALDGSFIYTPASGTVFTVAGIQTLSTNFTPTDTTNYDSVNATTVALNITSSGSSGGGGGGSSGGSRATTPTTPTTPTSTLSAVAQKVDANKDNKIDVLDFNSLMVNWGNTTANNVTDFNGDSKVDVFDFNLLMINWTL